MPVFLKNSLHDMLRYVPAPCLWGKKRKQSRLHQSWEGIKDTRPEGREQLLQLGLKEVGPYSSRF
jgi:hypothetical protein